MFTFPNTTNTTIATTTGLQQYYNLLGQQGMQAASSYVYPPTPTDKKIEVPIIDRDDRGGVFLRDEHGKLVHIDTERLYKAIGLEW
jgi:hypothetical protein